MNPIIKFFTPEPILDQIISCRFSITSYKIYFCGNPRAMNAFRKRLGKLLERKIKTCQYVTDLPGAPDGENVAIQFETSFENQKSAIETIAPMIDSDGKWRP